MNDNHITIEGNITGAPELRYTPAGMAVTTITVAHNTRVRDEAGNWSDGKATFIDVVCWGRLAQHVSMSCDQGTRVLVNARLQQNKWIDAATGQPRSRHELVADSVGLSLTFAPARSLKGVDTGSGVRAQAPAAPKSNGKAKAKALASVPAEPDFAEEPF